MTEENEIHKNGYNEGDLFSNGNDPASTSVANPKPLFPNVQNPNVKPLFDEKKNIDISAAPASDGVDTIVKRKLSEAGPTAFVEPSSAQTANPAQEMISRPDNSAPTSYIAQPSAPEIKEPIVVRAQSPKENSAPEIEIAQNLPLQENAMTASAPSETETSFKETKADDHSKLRSARPLPPSGPRYGKVRIREAIVPADIDRNKNALTIDPATTSIGKLMQNARKQAGMTLEAVASATRIKKTYIEAIEAEDFNSLPSGIFPSAYVRTLCAAYNLNEESRTIAIEKIQQTTALHEDVPEQLIQHLEQDVQKNVEEEKRINKIFYLVSSVAALFAILIIAGIVMLVVSLKKPGIERSVPTIGSTEITTSPRTPPAENFDTKQLEALTPPQIPAIMRELVVPGK